MKVIELTELQYRFNCTSYCSVTNSANYIPYYSLGKSRQIRPRINTSSRLTQLLSKLIFVFTVKLFPKHFDEQRTIARFCHQYTRAFGLMYSMSDVIV